jgi:hypothetical protein
LGLAHQYCPWHLAVCYAGDFRVPQPSIRWNDIIVGVALFVPGTWRYIRPVGHFWLSVINACIGLWLIAASLVLHCQQATAQVNDMTVGIAVFVASAVSASVRSSGE